MEQTYLIVGLGNPGNKYENTRHNVGFECIDILSVKLGISVSKNKFKGLIGEGLFDGNKVVLLKPFTYMNLSGESVLDAVNWYKIDIKNLILVYDDVDVELGKIRIRSKGSSGSHNGMKNIIYLLNEDGFPRVRIGIGRPENPNYDLADYVLSKFAKEERTKVDEAITMAKDAVIEIIMNGIDNSMNKYNNNNVSEKTSQ